MRKFMIRRLYSNRAVPCGTFERKFILDAVEYASEQQRLYNEQWRVKKGNRGPCPTIELLEVVFTGVPLRAEKKTKVLRDK